MVIAPKIPVFCSEETCSAIVIIQSATEHVFQIIPHAEVTYFDQKINLLRKIWNGI